VVEHDEFLSLSSKEVIKLISCNDIYVPFEEKVRKMKLIHILFYFTEIHKHNDNFIFMSNIHVLINQ